MKTFSSIAILALLVLMYGFVRVRPPDDFTGKTKPTVTQEMIITRKPAITATPNPYPGYP